jgi:erythromycin esterase
MVPLTSLDDRDGLRALAGMIGDARMVAISEAVHGGAEPLEFRNRLFEYLVREQGFTAIALESGIVESLAVHHYVRGGGGNLEAVLKNGITWTFDQLPQNRALVSWLKDYNGRPGRSRSVNFYGFDVSGSPGESKATLSVDTALSIALRYLARVDPTAGAAFSARVDSHLQNFRFSFNRPPNAPGYDTLRQEQRDVLTAHISDLITLLERREGELSSADAEDYKWGYRAAIAARQTDAWLREIPLGWLPSTGTVEFPSEQTLFLSRASDVRDRAQADNMEWIVSQEGAQGKVLVYGHRFHLSAAPVQVSWTGQHQQVMGTYLRRRFGPLLVTIGNLICSGDTDCAGDKQTLRHPSPESFDGMAGEMGAPQFLLDLRTAPRSIATWLQQEHLLGQGPIGQNDDALAVVMNRAFDILYYIDSVTPACAPGVAVQGKPPSTGSDSAGKHV